MFAREALGYRICAVGLAISLAESDARQRQRAEETGRWGTAEEEKWLVTMGDVPRHGNGWRIGWKSW